MDDSDVSPSTSGKEYHDVESPRPRASGEDIVNKAAAAFSVEKAETSNDSMTPLQKEKDEDGLKTSTQPKVRNP